jgi:hypothetical protein
MDYTAANGYTVAVEKIEGTGVTWVVRVYRKIFIFRKRISSDWFLDGTQAERYAAQVREELAQGKGVTLLRDRQPGWVLRRPNR